LFEVIEDKFAVTEGQLLFKTSEVNAGETVPALHGLLQLEIETTRELVADPFDA
jgi:hypothetical protein